MRVAIAHGHLDTLGGGERAVLELARGFAPRHNVRLVVGRFRPDRTYSELTAFPCERRQRWEWITGGLDAQVVVTNSFGANLLALRHGKRVVYWVHSLRSRFLTHHGPRPDYGARRVLDWLAVRRAARVVANSRYVAGRVARLYGRPADEIIHPGVDLTRFIPGPAPEGAVPYAITVGRLSPEKGIDRLLEVFRALPGVQLRVVGAGDPGEEARLRQLAPANVTFVGPLRGVDLVTAYQGASVAVFAPRAEEFGLAPLEAMACGVPVVAVPEGGLAETVVSGETGFLVDDMAAFRGSTERLAGDAALRRRMGGAARSRAEQFSWQRTIQQLERVCLAVASLTI